MTLLRLQAEVLDALRRLEVPFEIIDTDDTDPGAAPLVSVSRAQRDVLFAWGVPATEVDDARGLDAAADVARESRRRAGRPGSQLDMEQAIIRDALKAATSKFE